MKNRGTENFHWWDFHHDWHPHSGEVIEEITLTIYVNGVEFVSLINLPPNGSHPRTERTPNDLGTCNGKVLKETLPDDSYMNKQMVRADLSDYVFSITFCLPVEILIPLATPQCCVSIPKPDLVSF